MTKKVNYVAAKDFTFEGQLVKKGAPFKLPDGYELNAETTARMKRAKNNGLAFDYEFIQGLDADTKEPQKGVRTAILPVK